MDRTGKVLHGIRSDAVDSLCATCRNESFGLDCRRRIGRMVYGMHISWGSKLKEIRKIYKRKVVLACIAGSIIFIVIGYSLFQLKATSANGRLFMWKISTLAIAESPLIGHGTGNFVSAYGRAQESYFANEEYSETEELVAGSPECAFNEYLQVATGIWDSFFICRFINNCVLSLEGE